jgi:glycosyltransferase involved in cell wall biosynthesis
MVSQGNGMKIGLNAIGFCPGKMGGVETYFRNLHSALQRNDAVNKYTLLCDEWNSGEFTVENQLFDIKICNYNKSTIRRFVRSALRKAIKVDILKAEPRYLDLDVVHHPFNNIMPTWNNIPSVLTFHDMQHEFYPQFFSRDELQRREKAYKISACTATRIIAISEHVKRCLIEKYSLPAAKIDVVYEGCAPEYRVIENMEVMGSVKDKYTLKKPFMYFPAATWPHKNHKNLLIALQLLKLRYNFDGELVLTGISMQSHGKILGEIQRLGLCGMVKILGYIPYEDLPYLYNLARLMVFPSLFEGFGIPLVEAMACGCPVVCSNVTSIPEVVGDAGLMFDPTSPEDMAEKIWSAWSNEVVLKGMISKGFERVRMFDWDDTAMKTLEVYKSAMLSVV